MRILPILITSVAVAFGSLLHASETLIKKGESVAFLGDSITQFGAQTPGGYVRLVESGLAANSLEIVAIPAGVSGHKSNQMLERLDRDVLSKKPTWMTLSCGVNDVWHGDKGVQLEDYKKNITEIVDRCQKAGVKVMVLTSTQIKPALNNPENVKLAGYNAFLRDLAKERKLPLADLNAAMGAEQEALKAAGVVRSLTVDGVHMNPYGNLMMARGVLRAFGLDDAQLATAATKWRSITDAVQPVIKLKLSLAEMEAVEELAASSKQTVDVLLSEQLSASLKSILASKATSKATSKP